MPEDPSPHNAFIFIGSLLRLAKQAIQAVLRGCPAYPMWRERWSRAARARSSAREGKGLTALPLGSLHIAQRMHLYPTPTGHEPLGVQLMSDFAHISLLDVAMALELVGFALILVCVLTPLALCVLMPASTTALSLAVVL